MVYVVNAERQWFTEYLFNRKQVVEINKGPCPNYGKVLANLFWIIFSRYRQTSEIYITVSETAIYFPLHFLKEY